MERITLKMLENKVRWLNKITGNPPDPWERNADGKLQANIGNYHLSGAYGGYCLHQHQTLGGGVTCISNIGYASKRELYNWIDAYMQGILDTEEKGKK